MQAAIRSNARPASGYWTCPDAGTRKKGYSSGKQKHAKDAQTVSRSDHDFLTAVFEPISQSHFSPVYSDENYMYLYKSAQNYAKLLGVEFKVDPLKKDFTHLTKSFEMLLPDNQYVDISRKKNKLNYVISDSREDNILYFIPCCIIDEIEGELREIYISFFSIFQHTQGLTAMSENIIFEYIMDELPDEQEEIDKDDDWKLLLANYQTGKIADTLELVDSKSKYSIPQLRRKIKKYTSLSEREKKILELINKGLDLFSLKKSIFHYSYARFDSDNEEYQEFYPVSIDRIITIVYDVDDSVCESMIDWVSQEANEQGYEYLSAGSLELTPKTKNLIEIDSYVEQFLNWINTFCYELCNA